MPALKHTFITAAFSLNLAFAASHAARAMEVEPRIVWQNFPLHTMHPRAPKDSEWIKIREPLPLSTEDLRAANACHNADELAKEFAKESERNIALILYYPHNHDGPAENFAEALVKIVEARIQERGDDFIIRAFTIDMPDVSGRITLSEWAGHKGWHNLSYTDAYWDPDSLLINRVTATNAAKNRLNMRNAALNHDHDFCPVR